MFGTSLILFCLVNLLNGLSSHDSVIVLIVFVVDEGYFIIIAGCSAGLTKTRLVCTSLCTSLCKSIFGIIL